MICRRSDTLRAFTLVELLAVIVVVGLLASLTVFVIGQARAKATAAGCRSNLRQLATAYLMFANDNRGNVIPSNVTESSPFSEGGHRNSGLWLLRRHYLPGPRYLWTEDHKPITDVPLEKCPTAGAAGWSGTGYGISNYMSGNKLSFYQMPAQTPMLWDGNGGWSNADPLPLRHTGGLHSAFLDGHVEWISGGDQRLYSNWWQWVTQQSSPNPARLGVGTALGADPATL